MASGAAAGVGRGATGRKKLTRPVGGRGFSGSDLLQAQAIFDKTGGLFTKRPQASRGNTGSSFQTSLGAFNAAIARKDASSRTKAPGTNAAPRKRTRSGGSLVTSRPSKKKRTLLGGLSTNNRTLLGGLISANTTSTMLGGF